MEQTRAAFRHSPTLGNSRAFRGALLTIPVGSESTHGRLAVVEARFRPGSEPPPHIHEWEDELFYVLEGCAEFFCGKERFIADAGDCVFIPRGMPHTMTFLTPCVRALAVISAVEARPVNLDQFFLLTSAPARSLDLPAPGTPTGRAAPADPARAARLAAEHGMRVLSPGEARKLMPGYPGSASTSAERGHANAA